jgi:prevent-host-death family protein
MFAAAGISDHGRAGGLLQCYGRYVPTRRIAMKSITARQFNRDVSAAKREADRGPVVITDRGKPAFVLLSIEEYRRLGEKGTDLVARLSMAEDVDIDFEPITIGLREPEL